MELDPETIEGDYAESYQRWTHHFDKCKEQKDLNKTQFAPCEDFFEAKIESSNWKAFSESIIKIKENSEE